MPDREIALGRELTKLHETMYRGTPSQVLDQMGSERRGEMVLVIAGAGAKSVLDGAAPEPAPPPPGAALPGWAERFLDAAREGGMTLREAAKPLAKHLGVAASDVYRMASERPGSTADGRGQSAWDADGRGQSAGDADGRGQGAGGAEGAHGSGGRTGE
jgi:16S rRNA (cytidine1402-2'-O)-methyltransferase